MTNKNKKIIEASKITGIFPETQGNITNLINLDFYIVDVEFTTRTIRGEEIDCAIVTVEREGKIEQYFTWSKVLLNQLRVMEKYLSQGYKIKATLKKVKNYYTFV